jgi:molybdate transport system substrate-binding protein
MFEIKSMLKLIIAASLVATPLYADTLKVLTAGAFKAVIMDIIPTFELETGHKVTVESDTVGGGAKRIQAGEGFDFVIGTPGSLTGLAKEGFITGESVKPIAKVGIGIALKEGAIKPPLATVEDFKAALMKAQKIVYIDPAAGGSSGIYTDKLLRDLGVYDNLKPKIMLMKGGYVAESVAKGEADFAIHQISEILPVKGVYLAAPLPEAIQNYTIYAVGISAKSDKQALARQFYEAVFTDKAAQVIVNKGMSALK